jgi:putative tricarboxylic transport membrane protein
MSMKRVNQLFGCILLAVFLFLGYTARTTVRYWTEGAVIGPGPGYFPFWICMILSGLTLYWLVQITMRPGEVMAKNFVPDRAGGLMFLLVFADMVFFTLIMERVGFPIAMFIFIMVMVTALGKRTLRTMIYYTIFSVGVTAFFAIVFGQWLEVAFPKAEIAIIKAIGL